MEGNMSLLLLATTLHFTEQTPTADTKARSMPVNY
jgi:hypothetical protein